MILKASQRGGARALTAHLLNSRDNDHVEVVLVHGFMSKDVSEAFLEVEAASRVTRCRQPFLSLSMSPPELASVTSDEAAAVAKEVARRLGLEEYPMVLLAHEKAGRRHYHAVVSRIGEDLRAANLPFFKVRLNELSKEQFLERGWKLPAGFRDPSLSDPTNFDLAEWHAAKRAKRDPRELKASLKLCWSNSDGAVGFRAALQERGFYLARGDRRGFVAVDYLGNVFSLSRWLDIRPADLTKRIGKADQLPCVNEVSNELAQVFDASVRRELEGIRDRATETMQSLYRHRQSLVAEQRGERDKLLRLQAERTVQEAKARAAQFRTGLRGLWDWVTGRRGRLEAKLRLEFSACIDRDQRERAMLQQRQLAAAREARHELDRCRRLEARQAKMTIRLAMGLRKTLAGRVVLQEPDPSP